ncbi:MAG: hypothetical protein WCE51_10115 [Chthoniobacterales bacterium]
MPMKIIGSYCSNLHTALVLLKRVAGALDLLRWNRATIMTGRALDWLERNSNGSRLVLLDAPAAPKKSDDSESARYFSLTAD